MEWRELQERSDLAVVDTLSEAAPVVIFKHSGRCLLSSMILSRLERAWRAGDGHHWFFLDLLRHRGISDLVADRYDVAHASPQILVIDRGRCMYSASHNGIAYDTIMTELGSRRPDP
jgi:bacillithiol system protein YtxJ